MNFFTPVENEYLILIIVSLVGLFMLILMHREGKPKPLIKNRYNRFEVIVFTLLSFVPVLNGLIAGIQVVAISVASTAYVKKRVKQKWNEDDVQSFLDKAIEWGKKPAIK